VGGRTIGPYEVVDKLGQGGMGEVYRARDTRLDREVAVKLLPESALSDAVALERFRREARLASALNHPHICAVYDLVEHDGRIALIMELIEGTTLSRTLEDGALALERAVDLAIEVADALVAAHARGVVHRDLKPANIAVTTRGHAKVLDFGIARVVGALDEPTVAPLTDAGQAIGTASYMSPEQARGESVDARSDLFSLGLVLYEMVTGHRAIEGQTMALLFDALLNRPAPSVRACVPGASPELDRIVSRLLAKTRTDRYQSATHVLEELRVLRQRLNESGPARASGSHSSTAPPSVAVLPFASLSSDPENEYLADGLTDEVINTLGRLKGLRVVGRTSSFAFKGKTPEIADVGHKLNVTSVVTGSVRKAGNRLRITAELVSAADGFVLWSERFDRTGDDVFAIQDEMATSIVGRLRVELSGGADMSLVRRATDNLDAYHLYLKGRFFLGQRGDGILKGLQAFEQALVLDPKLALAHAGVAEAYSLFGFYGLAPSRDVMPKARHAATRAIELDDHLAEPHGALQVVSFCHDWDWAASTREFDTAMSKGPNSVSALNFRALELMTVHGRTEEALAICQRVLEIDPLSPYGQVSASTAFLCAGRSEEAILAVRRALEIVPDMWIALRLLGLSLAHAGHHDDALEVLERAVVASRQHPWPLLNVSEVLDLAGRKEESRATALEVLALGRERYVQPSVLMFAAFYAEGLDAALSWVDRAIEERDILPVLNYFPVPAAVRRDPRWQAAFRRMGLTPHVPKE
jgi:serine/threonine-protein kinase